MLSSNIYFLPASGLALMSSYQIIQCDIHSELISGTYETLESARIAWDQLIGKREEMNYISMELVDDELDVIDTFYWD